MATVRRGFTQSKSTLEGFDDLQKGLKDLPRKVEKRVLQNAVMAAGRIWLKAVKARAPEHHGKQSKASQNYGTIRENLRLIRLKFGLPDGTKGARVDTGDAFWSIFLELGTRFISARPFMAPAIESAREEALAKMADNLGKGIEKEAAKMKGAK